MNYKLEEIETHFADFVSEQDAEWLRDNWEDLHHHAFNTDYYIIGRREAINWLGEEAFNIIELVKNYELENFGSVFTDLSEPERIVNMYAYIVGMQVVSDWQDNTTKQLIKEQ